MTLPPIIATAVAEFTAAVRTRFGTRVRELVLFGSYARGEGRHPDSDVDICVVIDDLTWDEDRELTGFAANAMTRHGVLIGGLTLSTARMAFLRGRELLIADEIARDGIPL